MDILRNLESQVLGCARLVITAMMSVTVVSYVVAYSSRLFSVLDWFPVSAVEPRYYTRAHGSS
jgi:hypothetical protein